MKAQSTRLAATSENVANSLTPGYARRTTVLSQSPTGGVEAGVTISDDPTTPESSNVDLAEEMLSTIDTQNAFAANARVFEAGADMWDVLMSIKRD